MYTKACQLDKSASRIVDTLRLVDILKKCLDVRIDNCRCCASTKEPSVDHFFQRRGDTQGGATAIREADSVNRSIQGCAWPCGNPNSNRLTRPAL